MGDSTVELWKTKQLLQKEVNKLKRNSPAQVFVTADSSFLLVSLSALSSHLLCPALDIQDMHAQLMLLMDQYDITLPQLPDFDFSRLETEWNRVRSNILRFGSLIAMEGSFKLEEHEGKGLSAEYPVVLIPGGYLLVWNHGLLPWNIVFLPRKALGGLNMPLQVTFNRDRWIAAMIARSCHRPRPPDAKIRAAEGIDAAKRTVFFKVEEYDRRVQETTKKKTVVAARYSWLLLRTQSQMGRNPRNTAAEDLIGLRLKLCQHSCPENEKYVLERFFSRAERRKLFLSWAGSASMWIKGRKRNLGATLLLHLTTLLMLISMKKPLMMLIMNVKKTWSARIQTTTRPQPRNGGVSSALVHTHGEFIAFRQTPVTYMFLFLVRMEEERTWSSSWPKMRARIVLGEVGNMTAETADSGILSIPSTFQKMMDTNYSFGIERDEEALKRNNLIIEITERSFDEDVLCLWTWEETEVRPSFNQAPLYSLTVIHIALILIRNGVKLGEGDGTVSLLSLGSDVRGGVEEAEMESCRN
ncbi:hypothetical protein BT96DRAFT_975719 [Gymnopus androsaceus JB14]|uniref:Uncharacterized protein n=1 Tax=Gymnopus androsaceus JB14 TaxID=1447944 RepID=A0A6A4HMS9_9AGAR|nr:hypothetical protein BT96DRAFT_975719 [Gymnopus androsaceus JB14]